MNTSLVQALLAMYPSHLPTTAHLRHWLMLCPQPAKANLNRHSLYRCQRPQAPCTQPSGSCPPIAPHLSLIPVPQLNPACASVWPCTCASYTPQPVPKLGPSTHYTLHKSQPHDLPDLTRLCQAVTIRTPFTTTCALRHTPATPAHSFPQPVSHAPTVLPPHLCP